MSELKTISTIFLVPTLKIDRENLIKNNFVNGYIGDIQKEVKYEDAVYLLFKPKDMDQFQWFLHEEYDRTETVIEDYDYGEYIVVIYQLPKKFKEDFELVKKGKYSKTSKSFKNLFPQIVKIIKNNRVEREDMSLQWKIFTKSEDLKRYWEMRLDERFNDDMEMWEGWDETKEILDITKIKQEV